ncbi:host attachment family protein [Tsuneonella sp. YG55]|uniref:Host attachment family protein n=1 Tax=Tsuneonella litorea TaxID=2976475 RepID=A0A9X2VYE0_9SPHN|nr:host attachment family protein [Tsuneonella litorea]MCT2557588.1 host attachment family protein [Tsuneonella litorea]
MRIPAKAHVAIADGERFLLMRNGGTPDEAKLELVEEPSLDGEQESGAFGHHDPKSDDYHTQEKLDHAASAASWLNRAVLQHWIEELVVVADPDTLGEMRRHFHVETRDVLVAEIDKQVTGMPGPEILEVIEGA